MSQAHRGPTAWGLLRVRDFRLLLLGQLITGSLGPVIFVVQILWVLDQAPAGWEIVMVGAVGTLRGVGTIGFGLYAGALADRFDRRRLLIALQVAALVLALASAGVARWLGGTAEGVALFYLLTLGVSAVQPADMAARNAVVSEVLGAATQTGLGALQFAWQVPALFTLLFSGDIISALGFDGAFLLIAGFSALNAATLVPLRYRTRFERQARAAPRGIRETAGRAVQDVREGMRFARRDRLLFWTIMLLVVSQAATFPAVTHLGATWLTEVLEEPGTSLGRIQWPWLLSGAVTALILAGIPTLVHKTRVVVVGAVLFPVAVLVYALPQTLTSAFLGNFGFGSSQSATLVSTVSLVQERVPNEMRGRVMSLVQLNQGTAQLLTLPIAGIGQAVSLTVLLPAIGFGSLFLVVAIAASQRQLWTAASAPGGEPAAGGEPAPTPGGASPGEADP